MSSIISHQALVSIISECILVTHDLKERCKNINTTFESIYLCEQYKEERGKREGERKAERENKNV